MRTTPSTKLINYVPEPIEALQQYIAYCKHNEIAKWNLIAYLDESVHEFIGLDSVPVRMKSTKVTA